MIIRRFSGKGKHVPWTVNEQFLFRGEAIKKLCFGTLCITLTGFETWVFWNNYSKLVNMLEIKKPVNRSNFVTCELFVQLWPWWRKKKFSCWSKLLEARGLSSLGGGNILRAVDARQLSQLGGGNILRDLSALGGGNILRSLPRPQASPLYYHLPVR